MNVSERSVCLRIRTIFVHAHLQTFLESTRLALIPMGFVHTTRTSSRLTSAAYPIPLYHPYTLKYFVSTNRPCSLLRASAASVRTY